MSLPSLLSNLIHPSQLKVFFYQPQTFECYSIQLTRKPFLMLKCFLACQSQFSTW